MRASGRRSDPYDEDHDAASHLDARAKQLAAI